MRAFLIALLVCTSAYPSELPRRSAGKYQVNLRLPPDGLAAQSEMEIEVRIEDASRPDPLLGSSPVIRAGVEAEVDMPTMAGMPAYRETAHPEGVPGDYGFHPTFAHGGEYRLRLRIAPPADEAFSVEFPLRVHDSDPSARRKARPPRFSLELAATPKTPKAGEAADLRLIVRDRKAPRAVYSSLDLAHEKPMHLVLVRADLTQFAHEHPEMSESGVFSLRHTFPEAGEYHLFADVVPRNAGSQILMARIKVSGARSTAWAIESADRSLSKTSGDLAIELKPASSPLQAGITSNVDVSVRDRTTGQPVTDLQPYLGAAGHFLLVHQDAQTFVHSHPREPSGPLSFLVRLPKPGLYRGWLQLQRGGAIVTTDFVLEAAGNR